MSEYSRKLRGRTYNQPLMPCCNVTMATVVAIAGGTSVSNTIQYVADIPLVYKARLKGFKPFRATSTFGSGGASPGVVQNADSIVDLP